MIFKLVGDGRPYPEHGLSNREWAQIPPRQVRLDSLVTTKAMLDLHSLLAADSTFYGDLFPHVVQWRGELYLETACTAPCARRSTSAPSCTPGCWSCPPDLRMRHARKRHDPARSR
ncbi:hypothetical protein GCM10020219_055730 [Nonomuraea dietziae]